MPEKKNNDPGSRGVCPEKDDPHSQVEDISSIIGIIRGILEDHEKILSGKMEDIKTLCTRRIEDLEKKVSLRFKIAIGISVGVAILYATSPPEFVAKLIKIIFGIAK